MNASPQNVQSLLIRMPNWIGDFVMATPLLTDLRARFPKAKITAMCQRPLGDLLLHDPEVDEVFSFRKPPFFTRRNERRDLIGKVRKGEYDWGVLTTNSLSSAWWFWQGKVKNRIGFSSDWRRLLLTHPLSWKKEFETRHLVEVYKELLTPLGISPSQTNPRLFISQQERQEASALLKRLGAQKRIVGINPGAAYGSAKCWLPERFRAVTEALVRRGDVTVLYFGDGSMKGLIEEICKGLPKSVLNLAGHTSLRELIALLEKCSLVLTNDSGPMHITSALGVPVIALFGSTDSTKTGPYRGGQVIQKQASCSPCFKRVCPIDFRCMKGIETVEVLAAIERKLDSYAGAHLE